jgi:hypothetical protein
MAITYKFLLQDLTQQKVHSDAILIAIRNSYSQDKNSVLRDLFASMSYIQADLSFASEAINKFATSRAKAVSTLASSLRDKISVVKFLLKKCKANGLTKEQSAYVLATAQKESSLRPDAELYDWNPGIAEQARVPFKGYHGRGFVQITWKNNYQKLQDILNQPLVDNPELAKVPDISADIIVLGMQKGLFTGKSLADYINVNSIDFKNARKIINGNMDYAVEIKQYAETYVATVNNLWAEL